jgi:hypothetical protein
LPHLLHRHFQELLAETNGSCGVKPDATISRVAASSVVSLIELIFLDLHPPQ